MKELKQLTDRIISRVNINLEMFDFDSENFVVSALDTQKMLNFFAFYGITSHHPIYFSFTHSNIAGSYFLGQCHVGRSAVYKSDVRGDELKRKGDDIYSSKNVPLVKDETITIRDSLLFKTLVHSNSHNPKSPEEFGIRSTISAHYANIHGTTLQGCFIGPFATVDLMNLLSCIVGEFSYVQAGELFHQKIEPGTVWVRTDDFEFKYKFESKILENYVSINSLQQPRGILYDFTLEHEQIHEELFENLNTEQENKPPTSAVNPYAVVIGDTQIGENVLVSQRAFLENAIMGDGSNAQENSFIINSELEGFNVTAHGGKIINSKIGIKTFVGFNSFLNGKADAPIEIGSNSIVMPHTIIDSEVPIKIPADYLVWGFIGCVEDLKNNTVSLSEFEKIEDIFVLGQLEFIGSGRLFAEVFKNRIDKILLENGALFKKGKDRGHAQDGQNISFNMIQPYRTGPRKGLYPSIRIEP